MSKPPLSEGTPPAEKASPAESGAGAPEEPARGQAEKSPFAELFALPADASDDQIKDVVNRHVQWRVGKSTLGQDRTILFMFDDRSISRGDANRIYRSASKADRAKPTLLIVHSPGGDISAAYFIAKLCREYTAAEFEVAVPRQAKSAATLICCGADKIHMGSLSELGPIDPQFGGIPALSLKHSVEHLAQLAAANPGAASMLSDYLAKSLQIEALGFYERVAESATHYAMRLLNARIAIPRDDLKNTEIAKRLVYAYKDHGFAIDSREACEIYGADIVATNSAEYAAANELYNELDFIGFFLRTEFNKDLAFTGGQERGAILYARPEPASVA